MIYLDNAATSFPKPPAVTEAFRDAMETAGGNPGRGGHAPAMRAAEVVYRAREAVATHFGSSHPEHVVFTYNATYALNFAIRALVRRGDHVLISNLEHNAVYRPIRAMAAAGDIRFDTFDAYGDTDAVLADLAAKLRPNTRLVVTLHRSNICSITLPIREIGRMLRARGIFYLVDASQSAGACNIDPQEMGITALCAPGHKGLYGPAGTGFVLFSPEAAERSSALTPTIFGGTGLHSRDGWMPEMLPERLEAGTLAAPLLAALTAGIAFVDAIGTAEIAAEEAALARYTAERLLKLPHITLHAGDVPHTGTLLFSVTGMSAEAVAAHLAKQEICVRAGLHCAPLAHKRLGTAETGAVRASFGVYNTRADADALCAALENV